LSSAANPSVWQVLVAKRARADSEMLVQYLQSHIFKNIPNKFWFYNYLKSSSVFVFTLYYSYLLFVVDRVHVSLAQ